MRALTRRPGGGSTNAGRRRYGWGAVGSFALCAVWVIVVPDAADTTTGWQHHALRWGHAATWVLVGASLSVRVADGPQAVQNGLAYAGLGCYIVFLWALATS